MPQEGALFSIFGLGFIRRFRIGPERLPTSSFVVLPLQLLQLPGLLVPGALGAFLTTVGSLRHYSPERKKRWRRGRDGDSRRRRDRCQSAQKPTPCSPFSDGRPAWPSSAFFELRRLCRRSLATCRGFWRRRFRRLVGGFLFQAQCAKAEHFFRFRLALLCPFLPRRCLSLFGLRELGGCVGARFLGTR